MAASRRRDVATSGNAALHASADASVSGRRYKAAPSLRHSALSLFVADRLGAAPAGADKAKLKRELAREFVKLKRSDKAAADAYAARAAELNAALAPARPAKNTLDAVAIASMETAELKKALAERGLETMGLKASLKLRLLEACGA